MLRDPLFLTDEARQTMVARMAAADGRRRSREAIDRPGDLRQFAARFLLAVARRLDRGTDRAPLCQRVAAAETRRVVPATGDSPGQAPIAG